MRADEITSFAQSACDVIELYQGITAKQAAKIDALEKQASANDSVKNKIALDAVKLEKAASAVHEAFGQPANYPAEAIASFWKENPDAMSTTIHKLASKLVAMATPVVEEQEDTDIGRIISKKASADAETSTLNGKNDVAASSFWNNFK